MEKKVKIQLPKKYSVGIEVLLPMQSKEAMDVCQNFISTLSSAVGNMRENLDFNNVFKKGGKVLISVPLIRSIAEMKVEGLNNAFFSYSIPFKAFLEQED